MTYKIAIEGTPEAIFVFGNGKTCLFTDSQLEEFRSKKVTNKLLIRFVDSEIALLVGLLMNSTVTEDKDFQINIGSLKKYFLELSKIVVDKCHCELYYSKLGSGSDGIIKIRGLNFWISNILKISKHQQERYIPRYIQDGSLDEQINFLNGFFASSPNGIKCSNFVMTTQLMKMLTNLNIKFDLKSNNEIEIIKDEFFRGLFMNKNWYETSVNTQNARSLIAKTKSKISKEL